MIRRKKPKVNVKCVADRYAADGERIIEFMDEVTRQGGLISFRRTLDGTLQVDVYRCDSGVIVNGVVQNGSEINEPVIVHPA